LIENVVEGFATRNEQEPKPRAAKSVNDGRAAVMRHGFDDFESLFLAHYSSIVSLLRRTVGDSGQAEELASETFLRFYHQTPAPRADGNAPGWLYRTAMNLGIDALRAAARRNRFERDAAREDTRKPKAAEDGFDRTLRCERQHRVRSVLADLKPAQAQLLLLRASGHSYKDLASTLSFEPGSIGTLLARASTEFEQRYLERFGREEDL
jgi:RNA polymerase sigma factor (sigma-70 family)